MNVFKRTLKKLNQQQQALIILTFSLIAVIVWISVSLFSSQRRSGISDEQVKMSKPLVPIINKEVLLNLEKKQSFSNQELRQFPIYMMFKDQDQTEKVVEIGTQLESLPE